MRRGRLQLVVLFLVFFLPVLGALWLNVGHVDWMRFGTINYGELLQPPAQIAVTGLRSAGGQPVDESLLRKRWTLLLVTDGRCGASCLQLLSDTHRLRRGLGKDRDRVQRVVIVRSDAAVAAIEALHGGQPDLQLAVAGESWPGIEPTSAGAESGALFVVDPLGYVVLRYPLDADPRGLLKDLERMLKISKIG